MTNYLIIMTLMMIYYLVIVTYVISHNYEIIRHYFGKVSHYNDLQDLSV